MHASVQSSVPHSCKKTKLAGAALTATSLLLSTAWVNTAFASDTKPLTKTPATTSAKAVAKPTMADLIKASAATDWRPLDPNNTLYMDLEKGRVVIELAPDFAPDHVKNIKALVSEGYFNGLVVIRSQENYVVQWGDPEDENPAKKREVKTARKNLDPEFTVKYDKKLPFTRLPDADGFAPQVGHADGFPAGRDPKTGTAWLAHCYASVGIGRSNEVTSGDGSSMYIVSGHAPRQLDRNVTLVGRIRQGIELLTTLPRGTGPLGFYKETEIKTPIKSIRIAADVPEAERSKLEVIRTDTPTFKAIVEAQRNRGGDWYKVPAGYIDLCNVPIPVRAMQ
ncbi:peptidylprolyl isomerase [Undibacterium sp. RTI2.1]|uniref:peptidylprolyl isomerase n=1 Tax=unclassified Undibacterium TaxID=2630295 RepID=UPI002AB3E458|nr:MULTISPECIES: peptidylprolyl isomerase [unclassified Undibacterium]MDY7538655.1 peptidylprolyl isomerase [Undibacterium sp. 5I1]MEB0030276.1 peptidylprolyl isomerase [Undibacterium sp. RTI2.1]MEB0116900.1 peptidylprolyl isomerase [Undibacterium sp. RTI2.2]MEB0232144.1 peptidylprolyl isomerase [Undibacterium sp. 10I3]MEB0259458.1 peptidylprolyl isomerase [Undibacterium sp. 5I1]